MSQTATSQSPQLELCHSLSKHTWPLNGFPGGRFKPVTPWPDPFDATPNITALCCNQKICSTCVCVCVRKVASVGIQPPQQPLNIMTNSLNKTPVHLKIKSCKSCGANWFRWSVRVRKWWLPWSQCSGCVGGQLCRGCCPDITLCLFKSSGGLADGRQTCWNRPDCLTFRPSSAPQLFPLHNLFTPLTSWTHLFPIAPITSVWCLVRLALPDAPEERGSGRGCLFFLY